MWSNTVKRMNNCLNCGKEYAPKRVTSKYCSDACKVAFNRNKPDTATPLTVTPVTVTPTGNVTVTTPVETTCLDNPCLERSVYNCTPSRPCQHCQANNPHKVPLSINHGPHKHAAELEDNEVNRVSLPGDEDYTGQALNKTRPYYIGEVTV